MIVSCPACSTPTRLGASEQRGHAEAFCRACGHRWLEIETIEAVDITDRPSRSLANNLPRKALRTIDHDEAPELEARRLADMAREAQASHAAEQAARARRWRSWAVFTAFFFSPIAAAALMPETIVAAAPISYRAYQALGLDVNVYGLEIRRVERQHAIINGQRILTIKGEISNVEEEMRKIPWLRFALVDASGTELYTWTLDTGARPLRGGETTGFVTRVQAPPEAAQNLKIRFAKASELRSDGGSADLPVPPMPSPASTQTPTQ